jgi:hypothetical protein
MSSELTELRARVLQWREQGGGRGSRIPDELWQEAIQVARIDGVYATAKATGFKYEQLKKRGGQRGQEKGPAVGVVVEKRRADGTLAGGKNKQCKMKATGEADAGSVSKPESGSGGAQGDDVHGGARFIALQVAPPPSSGSHTRIEVVGRHGDRMQVQIAGELVVVGLVQALWSRSS